MKSFFACYSYELVFYDFFLSIVNVLQVIDFKGSFTGYAGDSKSSAIVSTFGQLNGPASGQHR
jgi:hypothetical protein